MHAIGKVREEQFSKENKVKLTYSRLWKTGAVTAAVVGALGMAMSQAQAADPAKLGLEPELVIVGSGGASVTSLRAAAVKLFEEQTVVKVTYSEAVGAAALAAVKASGGRPD